MCALCFWAFCVLPWILNGLLSDDWDDNGMKTVIMMIMKKDTATTMTEKPKTKSTTVNMTTDMENRLNRFIFFIFLTFSLTL